MCFSTIISYTVVPFTCQLFVGVTLGYCSSQLYDRLHPSLYMELLFMRLHSPLCVYVCVYTFTFYLIIRQHDSQYKYYLPL